MLEQIKSLVNPNMPIQASKPYPINKENRIRAVIQW